MSRKLRIKKSDLKKLVSESQRRIQEARSMPKDVARIFAEDCASDIMRVAETCGENLYDSLNRGQASTNESPDSYVDALVRVFREYVEAEVEAAWDEVWTEQQASRSMES